MVLKNYLSIKQKSTILLFIIVTCLTFVACGPGIFGLFGMLFESRGEVVLDRLPLSEAIEGKKIDFIGAQIFWGNKEYNRTSSLYQYRETAIIHNDTYIGNLFKIDGAWDAAIVLFEHLNENKRKKLSVFFYDRNCCLYISPNLLWKDSWYVKLFTMQPHVMDEIGCINYFNTPAYKDGEQGKMMNSSISSIIKQSNADYFLVFAIRPIEAWRPDEEHPYIVLNVALITVMYNREGKKVYSEIYTESIESNDSEKIYYYCIMKLLNNQGAKINKDLSFLDVLDDAPYPTLEDMLREAYNYKRDNNDLRNLYLQKK